jgi:hypothetical protein
MIRMIVERGPSTDEGTFGTASIGGITWDSLEQPWRGNQHDVSCVPPGVYKATIYDSPHFGRQVYLLQGVPGRTDVEIHPANWAGDRDKGWHSDLKGCLTIGESIGILTPDIQGAQPQQAVERSGPAFDALMAITGGAEIAVEIRWAPGADPGSYDAPATPVA